MIDVVDAPDAALLEHLAVLHERAFAPTARGWTAAEVGALARDCDLYISANGFALIRTVLDEAEVLTIAVDPIAQRNGEGRALLAHVLLAHPRATYFLEVAADNGPALALYRSSGFEEVGRRKGYYHRVDARPVDAFTMRRSAS